MDVNAQFLCGNDFHLVDRFFSVFVHWLCFYSKENQADANSVGG